MSLKTFGSQGSDLILQPGWNLSYNDDETITGNCSFKTSEDKALSSPLRKGQKHPKSERAELISWNISGLAIEGKCIMSCEYFGLQQIPTKPRYEYYNATNEEAIETHPDFASFGGSEASPETGAIFDSKTKAFLGFSTEAASDLIGVRGFLSGAMTIRKTWYSDSAYSGVEEVMKVKLIADNVIPGVPSGTDALKINWGSRRIGNFYEIWEEYQFSGAQGWSRTIYDEV
jgi:hypothetical protein